MFHCPSEKAWFAGLIDGEGCFTLSISVQHVRSLHIPPRFSISIKEGDWVKHATSIMVEHDIPFHARRRKGQVEVVVSSGKGTQSLIRIVSPYLVVKRPLALRLLEFPTAPPRNRFASIDRRHLAKLCELVDFVREFNRGKNRRHKWDGKTILEYFAR